MSRFAVALAGAAACVLTVTACSSSAGHSGPTGSSSGPASTPASATPTLTQHPLPPAQSIGNDVQLRKHVTLTGCAARSGGWGAAGTAINPTAKSVRYTITVFFTTTSATVLDYATSTVTVPAGGHAN
ncbi:MAG: hypothetical protein J0H43_15580, partial [Actinobacteria bacterium]|nr:hypothetical protein [Actinomycetota bacterium]